MEKLRKLLWITISIVTMVLALTGFGFYYIGVKSDQDSAREEIERISEKQQVLSQRIVRNILLARGEDYLENPARQAKLALLLEAFKDQQEFIISNVADAGLGSEQEKLQLNQLIKTLAPTYDNILRLAQATMNREQFELTGSEVFVAQVDRSELHFLDQMNLISAIARANQEVVDGQVYRVNAAIFATLILSLVILGMLVITPIFKKSIQDYRELLIAKDLAEVAGSALRESEEKYRNLFTFNPLPMWLLDPQGFHILDVNDIACSHYGYERGEFLSMSMLDIKADGQGPSPGADEPPETCTTLGFDRGTWRHRKKDGSAITVEIFAHDAVFNGGNALMVVINDITKRELAEEELRHSEANLRQAQQIAHFGHWELSFASGESTWSEEARRIYGLAEDASQQGNQSWLSFIHPQDSKRVLDQTALASQGSGSAEFSHRILLADGTLKHLFNPEPLRF